MQTLGNRQAYGNPFDFPWLSLVSSGYGYRVHPISGEKNLHRGVDIAVAQGTPIRAIHDGRVASAGDAGSYGLCVVIEDGNVWAPDGALLSQRTLSALPDAPAAPQETAPPLAPDPSSPAPPDALAPVYSIADLRPASDPSVLSGLKALVSSIFGEYRPITTTAVITETVGENMNQYLVETVASGAAGVDYEWLAGVFLFGILLFCLMKLLGGMLK